MKIFACHMDQAAAMEAAAEEKLKSLEYPAEEEVIIQDKCRPNNTNCIERPLRNAFMKYGKYIAKHPYPFIVIPLIMAACLSYGLRYFELENDTEYLVTPKNGPAKYERKIVKEYFHVEQDGGFLPDRSPVLDGFADVLIVSRDGGNMLTVQNMQSVINVEARIRNVTAYDDKKNKITFGSICATWGENCIDHPIFMVLGRNASYVNKIQLTYPQNGFIFLGQSLGNVTTNENTSVIEFAQTTRLTFYVRYETHWEQQKANLWFEALQKALSEYDDPNVIIYHGATSSLAQQFDEATEDIMPKFVAPFVLLILFSICSCMMNDWVRSKPLLALMGVLYAGLSLASSFGLLAALGIKAVPQAGLVPFLTLGVGVDNMFILISAWRRTDVEGLLGLDMKKRVEVRMSETMKEAALSITITSLTNVLAFGIGANSDFPTVELFCLYTGMSMLFSYLYCITFFAAAIVFSGWREEANRHCFSFKKVLAKKEAKDRSGWYRFWCTGGKPGRWQVDADIKTTRTNFLPASTENSLHNEESDHVMMKFFREYFGPGLMKPYSKAIVLIIYIGYLMGAIYGCMSIRNGVSFHKLSNTNSYLADYYYFSNVYFNQFGPAVQVVISEPLDYSKPEVQEGVERVLETFNNHTDYFYGPATQSWLRDYLAYLEEYPKQPKTSMDFLEILRYQFLKSRGSDTHRLDLSFDNEGTVVVASRFYLQSRWFEKTEDMMQVARKIAANITEYNVSIFHPTFVYFDQPVVVWSNTLQNIIIAIVCMFFVALFFVPHPLSAFWVTVATASIEAGVIGFMTLWDVNVDFISMTYLILCIGFSVDFSVHIAYGFISSEEKTGDKKAIDALYSLGWPVMQSGTSTLIAVVFLCLSISYLFLSFFKTMLLVIIFGVWHALFVLPVILSLIQGNGQGCDTDSCEVEHCSSQQLSHKGKEIFHLFNECDGCLSETRSEAPHTVSIEEITDKCTSI